MNAKTPARAAVSTTVVALALMLGMPSVHAASRCEQPTIGADARACAAEREGPEALRRFVTRTRMIYELYYGDLRRPEPEALSSATAPHVASLQTSPAP